MKLFTSLTTNRNFSFTKSALLFLLFVSASATTFAQGRQMAKLSVQLLLNLNGGPNNTADGLVAVFANNFSSAIGNEDSYKFNNIDENIAISRNGTNLSIEGRPTIVAYDTLPLKMWQFRHNSYFFKLDASNFSKSLVAVIKDKFLKTEIPVSLTGSTVVPLKITGDAGSYAANRFVILFRPAPPKMALVKNIKTYATAHGVQVEWTQKAGEKVAEVIVEKSKNGRDFNQATLITNADNTKVIETNYWLDASADATAIEVSYRITTISTTGEASYSDISKISGTQIGMTVYPNPATGNRLNVKLNGAEGTYTINLLNSMGQVAYSTKIVHNGGTATQPIATGKQMPKGMYTLQVTNGSFTKSELVIFQ